MNITFNKVSYNNRLQEINLQLTSGETLVLLGRSGSGKTTLLKLVNGLLMPTSGEVLIDGKATTAWDPIRLRRNVGYVIQDVGLLPHFTVEENVGLIPRLEGWKESRTEELLKMVGLLPEKFSKRYPRELSGGQAQRVGVARALGIDPPILLLDEPFGALDPITRHEIQREFLALQSRLQKTMLFVTHDVREAFLLATRIFLLKDGKPVMLGTPDELLHSNDPEVTAFTRCLS